MEDAANKIRAELERMEAATGTKVLLAVESGSRAWGFESPDSDYDVRFVYVRDTNWYLGLEKQRDTIEWRLDEVYDVVGWDLRKFLRLARKSNPSVMEWVASPIVYLKAGNADDLMDVAADCFAPRPIAYHYLAMARDHYRAYIAGRSEVSAKKWLYVLRCMLCAQWVCQRYSLPPVPLADLMEGLDTRQIQPQVDELLRAKAAMSEKGMVSASQELDAWYEETYAQLQVRVALIERDAPMSWERLDRVFLDALRG